MQYNSWDKHIFLFWAARHTGMTGPAHFRAGTSLLASSFSRHKNLQNKLNAWNGFMLTFSYNKIKNFRDHEGMQNIIA